MRSSKQRSRSKSNRPKTTLGNIVNRVFDSSGPEGKVRGTPQQIIDKYLVLARDAQLSNDRVAAENFLQHAEHYTRMLSEAQRELAREQEMRREQQQQQQNHHNRRADGRDGPDRQGGGRDEAEGPGDQGGRDYGERRPEGRDDRRDRHERADEAPLAAVEAGDESDSMLVETPESRARRHRGESTGERGADASAERVEGDGTPEPAAGVSGDEQPARKPRARRAPRKPKSTEPGPDADGGSAAAAE